MSFKRELAISLPILMVIALVASHMVVVPTGSMAPSINEGDMVFAEKVDVLGLFGELHPETIKEGDIIIYEESNSSYPSGEEASASNAEETTAQGEETSSSHGEGQMIIHRVVAINESNGEKYFILKGDANSQPDDEKVHPANVEGRIFTWDGKPVVIPQVGWLILWFKG